MRIHALALTLPFLTACHADVTFQFDVHRNGTVTATTRDVLDDQLYQLGFNQNTGTDPLGISRLQQQGWAVSRAVDNDGNHVITMSKVLRRQELSSPSAAVALRGAAPPFSSLNISRSPAFFVERDSLSATVPALLSLALSTVNRHYSSFATDMLGSVVALHFELRAPGKVLATNGAAAPNGFTRWDLNLQSPTRILYSVRIVRIDRIVLVVLVLAALLASAFVARLRRDALRSA